MGKIAISNLAHLLYLPKARELAAAVTMRFTWSFLVLFGLLAINAVYADEAEDEEDAMDEDVADSEEDEDAEDAEDEEDDEDAMMDTMEMLDTDGDQKVSLAEIEAQ